MAKQYVVGLCLVAGALVVPAQPATGLQFAKDTVYSIGVLYPSDSVWLRHHGGDTLAIDSIVPTADGFPTMEGNTLTFSLVPARPALYADHYGWWLSPNTPYLPAPPIRLPASDSVLLRTICLGVPYIPKALGPLGGCAVDTVRVRLAFHGGTYCDTVVVVAIADMTAAQPQGYGRALQRVCLAHVRTLYNLRGARIRRPVVPSEPMAAGGVVVERRTWPDGVSTRCLVQVRR